MNNPIRGYDAKDITNVIRITTIWCIYHVLMANNTKIIIIIVIIITIRM
jgi:hypothetical protein